MRLKRHELVPRGRLDHQPPSLSWDYLDPYPGPASANTDSNLALVTCDRGHTLRLVGARHRVAEDGTVHPSWVCAHPGCSFHAFIQLEGWSPDRGSDGTGRVLA